MKESYATSFSVDKAGDQFNQPDYKKSMPNIIHTTRSSAVPRHWSNSPYMSGGMYGANPEFQSDDVLTYKEFLKIKNKVRKFSF